MGESDHQAHFRRNTRSYYNADVGMSLERFKTIVALLLEEEKIPEVLHFYTRACSSHFLNKECLLVLIDGIVKIARRILMKSKRLSFDSFRCSQCHAIYRDPVTLNCGHTFSKKCMISSMKNVPFDSFTCTCGKSFSYESVASLKNNVTILSLIDKLNVKFLSDKSYGLRTQCLEIHHKKYGPDSYVYCSCDVKVWKKYCLHICFEKEVRTFRDFQCEFTDCLIALIFDPDSPIDRDNAVKVLREALRNYLYPPSSEDQKPFPIRNSKLLNRKIKPIENSLRSSRSSDIIHIAEDEISEDEDMILMTCEYGALREIVNYFLNWIKTVARERGMLFKFDTLDRISILDLKEVECSLCMRLLWEPVTTTCGHTFCRVCLNRWFDHQPNCPLCKTSLTAFVAERVQSTTELIDLTMEHLFPVEYAERKANHLEELEELTNAGKDPEHEIPLFVCTVALPTVPCPLHVFEPRYRLMIRQCIESGSRQFGMCGVINDKIAEYGTMLEIRNIQYFPDGRSIVDTVGQRRFRILRKGERDGYHTGAVEFLQDRPLSDEDRQCIEEKHNRTYKESKVWFQRLPVETRLQILRHFGPMPHVETDYLSSPNGPSWSWWLLAILPVETKLKVFVISLTSLPHRLEMLYRILLHFQSDIMP